MHVDDMQMAGDLHNIQGVYNDMAKQFDVTDEGDANWYLGMKIERNCTQRSIKLLQEVYTQRILDTFDGDLKKTSDTLIVPAAKLNTAEEAY